MTHARSLVDWKQLYWGLVHVVLGKLLVPKVVREEMNEGDEHNTYKSQEQAVETEGETWLELKVVNENVNYSETEALYCGVP